MKKYLFIPLMIMAWSCEEEKANDAKKDNITFVKDFSSYTSCGYKPVSYTHLTLPTILRV